MFYQNWANHIKKAGIVFSAAGLIFLSGCATTSDNGVETTRSVSEVNDPFEGYNRAVFAFNEVVDKAVIEPVARGYRAVIPTPARKGVRNFLRNLRSPLQIGHQVLQGDFEGAANATTRTVVNTLIGVGGLFDVAGYEGIKHEEEDFGQTFAVWGVKESPYVVLPLMGPSTLRDSVGLAIDGFIDPLRLYLFNIDEEHWHYIRTGTGIIDQREALLDVIDDLRRNSFDYYAAVRSAYIQNRNAMINDQDPDALQAPEIPDYDF